MIKNNLRQREEKRADFLTDSNNEEGNSPYLGHLLNEAAYIIRSETENELKPLGLSPRLFGTLDIIAYNEPLSQRALGGLRKIDRTTIVAQVDRLEADGFIKRADNPNDRREYALIMTEKGSEVVRQARAATRKVEKQFLKNLPAEDCRKLLEILWRLFQTQDAAEVLKLPSEIDSLCETSDASH